MCNSKLASAAIWARCGKSSAAFGRTAHWKWVLRFETAFSYVPKQMRPLLPGYYICDGACWRQGPGDVTDGWLSYNNKVIRQTTGKPVCQLRHKTIYLLSTRVSGEQQTPQQQSLMFSTRSSAEKEPAPEQALDDIMNLINIINSN